jgi:hypothetical protein
MRARWSYERLRIMASLAWLGGCVAAPLPEPGAAVDGLAATTGAGATTAVRVCALPGAAGPFRVTTDGSTFARYECVAPCTGGLDACARSVVDEDEAAYLRREVHLVVDGMGASLRYSEQRGPTVFVHTGGGGTGYYPTEGIAKLHARGLRTVEVKWEPGILGARPGAAVRHGLADARDD